MQVRSRSWDRPRLASMRRCDPRAAMTLSTGAAVEEGHVHWPAPFPRPAEPVAFPGPLGRRDERELHRSAVHRAGGRRARQRGGRAAASPRATTATGNSCTRSAPVSAATSASGKRVYSPAARPAESASASNWASIVPASQYTCR